MATNYPEYLSEEHVLQAIENPGQTVSNSILSGPEAITARPSVDISQRAGKGLRPAISGNSHDNTQGRISRPSGGLAGRLAAGDARQRLEAAQLAEEETRKRVDHDPEKLSSRISYLESQLKKLTTEISKLKKVQP